MKALDLGALGFIPKSGQREVMLSAFNLIFSGGVYIPPEILNRREPAAAARAAPAPAKAGASAADLGLTERQMQVLESHRSGHCRHCPRPRGGPGRPIDDARGCALRAHPQPTEAWGRFGKVQHAADSLRAAWRNWFGGCGMKPGCPLFTLDACRHGGMTELEEAELTDGQGRALSAHKSRAYEGYAKRTMERALAATRKRHAHRITASSNAQGTDFGMKRRTNFGMLKPVRTVRPNNYLLQCLGWLGRQDSNLGMAEIKIRCLWPFSKPRSNNHRLEIALQFGKLGAENRPFSCRIPSKTVPSIFNDLQGVPAAPCDTRATRRLEAVVRSD